MTTRERILEHLGTCHDAEMARRMGISRERVRQLKNELHVCHIKVPAPRKMVCPGCGVPTRNGYRCPDCSAARKASIWITLACDWCGREYPVRVSYYHAQINRGYKYHFCGRTCRGRHNGIHYGFRAHPENAGHHKWDWDKVWQLHQEGYPPKEVGTILGMPGQTVSNILWKKRKEAQSNESKDICVATPPALLQGGHAQV